MDYAIVFGDVFRYRGDEYVYFAESPEEGLVFAGKILDVGTTNQLQALQARQEKAGKPTHNTPAFSFVVLSSAEFDKRAVLCALEIEAAKQLSYPHASLTNDDVARIKEEILTGVAPKRLQELVQLLT